MDGRHKVCVVLAQRNDPLTGVLRISLETVPGNAGHFQRWISLSSLLCPFTPRKKGKDTVSIVRSAHDNPGGRIENARNPTSQGESIEIATTRTTWHEANR